jgi:hypothetical protein
MDPFLVFKSLLFGKKSFFGIFMYKMGIFSPVVKTNFRLLIKIKLQTKFSYPLVHRNVY